MRVLSFDTSTEWLTVAAGDGGAWTVHQERAGSANSERILPVVDAVLAEAGRFATEVLAPLNTDRASPIQHLNLGTR